MRVEVIEPNKWRVRAKGIDAIVVYARLTDTFGVKGKGSRTRAKVIKQEVINFEDLAKLHSVGVKGYKIKITTMAFGVWTEEIRVMSEKNLLHFRNNMLVGTAMDIMDEFDVGVPYS